jgi:voltage-gated potassium channel
MNRLEAASFREKSFIVIFGDDTPPGRLFDFFLIVLIVLSVTVVMLESVQSVNAVFGAQLRFAEWFFTILFTIEYLFRVWCVKRPKGYVLSAFGLIDLISILPSYFSLLLPGMQVTAVVRVLRVVRVFRILKLAQYVGSTRILVSTLKASRYRITVFLVAVSTVVTIMGSFMYLIESPKNGFTSIPMSVYWAIVTVTTVGYGDMSPATPLGQALASMLMLMGYAIIVVPMGLFAAEMVKADRTAPRFGSRNHTHCMKCSEVASDPDVHYCSYCGRNVER